jgi:hypothetical protein
MRTTKSECSQSQFHSLVFMNVKVEKVLSSSIDPIIWTTTNFATLVNSESQTHNNALEECFFQSLDIGLTSMGCYIAPLDIIMILKTKTTGPKCSHQE